VVLHEFVTICLHGVAWDSGLCAFYDHVAMGFSKPPGRLCTAFPTYEVVSIERRPTYSVQYTQLLYIIVKGE
jgi:hypothetical protein